MVASTPTTPAFSSEPLHAPHPAGYVAYSLIHRLFDNAMQALDPLETVADILAVAPERGGDIAALAAEFSSELTAAQAACQRVARAAFCLHGDRQLIIAAKLMLRALRASDPDSRAAVVTAFGDLLPDLVVPSKHAHARFVEESIRCAHHRLMLVDAAMRGASAAIAGIAVGDIRH